MSEIEVIKERQTITYSLMVDSQVVKNKMNEMEAEGWEVEEEQTDFRNDRIFIDLVRVKHG